jgi:hypothetical protein
MEDVFVEEKKFSDEIIIDARCEADPIINQFLGKCNKYGDIKYSYILSHAENAEDSANDIGLDGLVAR